jgi:hypothetical protein
MRILKCVVDVEDAAFLISALLANGEPSAVTAAREIRWGMSRGIDEIGLTPAERDATLTCLHDAPQALMPLREALARDRWRRLVRPRSDARASLRCRSCGRSFRASEFKPVRVQEQPSHASDDPWPPRAFDHACPSCGHIAETLGRTIVY